MKRGDILRDMVRFGGGLQVRIRQYLMAGVLACFASSPFAFRAIASAPAADVHANPLHADPMVREAYRHFYELDYPACAALLEKVQAAHPGDPGATALLLEAYHEDLWSHVEPIPDGNEYLEWMGLLRSATAFEAYCKVYTADVTPDRILEFLLLDEEFPHSVRFSIDTLQTALEAIHGEGGKSRAEPLRRLVGRLQSSLNYSSVEEILHGDVVAYLRGIQRQCRGIHEMIYQLYIDYSIQAALAG